MQLQFDDDLERVCWHLVGTVIAPQWNYTGLALLIVPLKHEHLKNAQN